MSSLCQRPLFELPRGFAVEKAVLAAGSLAASCAAGLAAVHFLKFPSSRGQLPGALSASGLSSASNTFGWIVPVVAVPVLWLAWLAILPRAARRWPRGPGSFYRDTIGFHFALLAAPGLLLEGARPLFAAGAVLAAGLIASAGWIARSWIAQRLALLAAPSGGLVAAGGFGLALASTAGGAALPASRLGQAVGFAVLALAPAVAAVAFSRGDPGRMETAARSVGFLFFAPALLVAGASLPLAVGAPLALGLLFAPFSSRISPSAIRTAVGVIMAPTLFLSAIWVASYRPHSPVSIFEDGHALGPAWEEFRGARAFDATLPLHGWMEDGGYEAASFRWLGPSYRWHGIRRAAFSLVTVVAIYILARGVYGQTGLAVLATSAALLLSRGGPGARAAPAILATAVFALGIRDGRRWIAALGVAMATASVFSSVDFGAYAVGGIGAACVFFWISDRNDRARCPPGAMVAAGALGAAPFVADLAVTGRLGRWIDFTFRLLPRLAREAYALPLPDPLMAATSVPRTRFLADPLIFAVGVGFSILLVRRKHPWGPGLLVCSMTYLFTFRSVAERLYIRRGAVYLGILAAGLAVFAISGVHRCASRFARDRTVPWWIRRSAATALVLAAGGAFSAALAFAATRETTAGLISSWRSWPARSLSPAPVAPVPGPFGDGTETTPETAARLMALRSFFDRRLAPDETFFDFSSQPGIHFLLGRRNPVPWVEVPAMEAPGAEEAIIRALDSGRVRYVLWSWPGAPPESYTIFDEVPNRVRVPDLFRYLERRFPRVANVEGCEIRFRE